MSARARATLSVAVSILAFCAASHAKPSESEQVAYLAQSDGFWQVWVMSPDGTGTRQVTRSAIEKTRLSWFPDGETLLVNSLAGELLRVSVPEGRETKLQLKQSGMTDAMVSPGGERIAFSRPGPRGRDDNDLWLVALDDETPRLLASMAWLQHDPSWSPDGRWVYFSSGDGGQTHDVWRVSPDSRSTEQITTGSLYNFDVSVGPDGSIAFSSNRSGDYEIWTQRGSDPARQLTHHPGLDAGPSWSPDGSTLLFHSTRSGALELWRVSRDGGEPVQLTSHGGARSAAWWGPGSP